MVGGEKTPTAKRMSLDIRSVLVTVVALPLVVFAFKRIRKFLQEHLSLALDAVFWVIGRLFVESLAIHFSLRRYCRLKLNDSTNKYLRVPGKAPTALETDAIFVPLDFEANGRYEADMFGTPLIEPGSRIRVIGDPGSGKSSQTKQIFREVCKRTEYAGRRSEFLHLPILIDLKRFTPPESVVGESAAGDWAVQRLQEEVESVRGFEMGKLFKSFIEGRGLVVLLDGLDEVASDDYPQTANAILGLSKRLAGESGNNQIILTMRAQFHQQTHSHFDEDFPVVCKIVPFTPTDIFRFLERWPFKRDRFDEVSRIYSDLTDRPTLREMCSNPLVLAMYVANDQEADTQSAPDTRTSFYDQVVDELLVARRSRQMGITARTTLREQREAILGQLALGNLLDESQGANALSWEDAVGLVLELTSCGTEAAAEKAIRDLERDTGIISEERSKESLRFIHLTFCEFLAAKEAAVGKKNGWADLLARHEEFRGSELAQLRSRLDEVIPFAAALLPRSHRQDAIEAVSALDSPEILGRCFLETQAYNGEAWREYVDKGRATLTDTPPEQWNAEWLRRLHLFNVVLHDAEDWAGLSGQELGFKMDTLFADLVGTDRERLVRLFSSYAINDSAAALRLAEACGVDLATEHPELVLENCEFPPFLATALQRTIGEGESHRWVALLAEAGLRSPLAARVMNSRDAPERLIQEFKAVPPKRRWAPLRGSVYVDNGRIVRTNLQESVSCYSVVLTLGLEQDRETRADLPSLSLLEQAPPPGSAVRPIVVRMGAIALGVVGFAALFKLMTPWGLVPFLCIWLWTTLAWMISMFPTFRSKYYQVAANLDWFVTDRRIFEHRHGSRVVPLANRERVLHAAREVTAKTTLRRLSVTVRALNDLRFEGAEDVKPTEPTLEAASAEVSS